MANLSTTSSGGTVSSGATLIVTSGGTAVNWTVAGTETISSGGVDSGARIASGGVVIVSSGGKATGETIQPGGRLIDGAGGSFAGSIAGGTLELQPGALSLAPPNTAGVTPTVTFTAAGGTIQLDSGITAGSLAAGSNQTYLVESGAAFTSNVVSSGGAAVVLSGGTAASNIIYAGGRETVSAGAATTSELVSGGAQTVLSGGVATATTVFNGGVETVSSGGLLAGVTTISGGGRVILNGTAGTGTLNLAGSGGTITLNGATAATNLISGFVAGDFIDLANVAAGSITGVTRTANAVTISAGGATYNLNVVGAGAEGYKLVADGAGGTFYEVCFAEGTRIAAPDAEIEVERLAVGDLVTTLDGPRPVTWIGHRTVDVARLADPDGGRLVRIRAGAFAASIPRRDLLVTREHCVFVDRGADGGRLIPARMLVNGRSIVIDRGIAAYTFYHVELAEHAILLAEGLTTESYLDTGNRSNFANSEVTAMRPNFLPDAAHKSWAADAAAPLGVDRATVEPIWAMLDARARQLGLLSSTAPVALVADPALLLVADDGMAIDPVSINCNRYMFAVPAGVSGLRLLSRTARPSETVGPFLDDRRALGVLVGEVAVWHGERRSVASPHLAMASLPGWFGIEAGPHRWTDGDAMLPLPLGAGPALVEVEVVAAGPYFATNAAVPAAGRLRRG